MTRLFLSGGGNAKQSKKLDELLVSRIPKEKRMLYIPVAMPPEEHSFEECFEWVAKTFSRHGFNRIDMLTKLEEITYEELRKYAAVYIGGGNTFYLFDYMIKSGFGKLLARYMKNNSIVYGGSAGAIILGKDILTAKCGGCSDINRIGLKDFKGFNLVRNHSIQCHYTPKDDKKIFEYIAKRRMSVIALPEETGIYVHGRKIKVIGYKNAYLFASNQKKPLKINSTF